MSTSLVNDKVKEVDQKLQVSEKAKSTYVAAEQTVSNAESAIMKNRYVISGVSWATYAFNNVGKAAGEVGQKTQEKSVKAEDEQRRKKHLIATVDEWGWLVDDYAQIHLSKPPPPLIRLRRSNILNQQHQLKTHFTIWGDAIGAVKNHFRVKAAMRPKDLLSDVHTTYFNVVREGKRLDWIRKDKLDEMVRYWKSEEFQPDSIAGKAKKWAYFWFWESV